MNEAHKMFNYKLPVNGNDVMDVLKISGGVLVKKVLDKLMTRVFPNPDTVRAFNAPRCFGSRKTSPMHSIRPA